MVGSQINFLLLVSRQGKVRLTKWYAPLKQKEKVRVMREVSTLVLNRPSKMCNFVEWRDQKIVYRKCVPRARARVEDERRPGEEDDDEGKKKKKKKRVRRRRRTSWMDR